MKQITFSKTFTIEEKVEPHKLLCEQMTKHFGKNCYWIPYKFPIQKVNQVFYQMEKDKDHNFQHLLQRLNHG